MKKKYWWCEIENLPLSYTDLIKYFAGHNVPFEIKLDDFAFYQIQKHSFKVKDCIVVSVENGHIFIDGYITEYRDGSFYNFHSSKLFYISEIKKVEAC